MIGIVMGIFDIFMASRDHLSELRTALREAWQMPELEPATEDISYRTWRSPFALPGLSEFAEALRGASGGVEINAPAAAWGDVVRMLLEKILKQEKISVVSTGQKLTVTDTGFSFAGKELTAASSVPLLALQVAEALAFSRSELFNRTIVAYDLEATGLGVHDELTEIGAVKIRNGQVIDEFQTLINPTRTIPPDIVELTSITNDMVRDAPQPAEAVGRFLEFFGDNETIAVVHNGGFDLNSIRRRAAKYHQHHFSPRVFDTRSFAQSVRPLMSTSLGGLALEFGVELKNAHRALADAKATGEIFVKAYSLQNVSYHQFLKDHLRLFALAVAAWPGVEGEAERSLLYHLFRARRRYRMWKSLHGVREDNFHQYRKSISEQIPAVLSGDKVELTRTRELPTVLLMSKSEINAKFVHTLGRFQPYLRHNPCPVFTVDGVRVTPVLQPHKFWHWLWPVVKMEQIK